ADLWLSVEARWYLDPLYGRGYPRAVWDVLDREGLAPEIADGDLAAIAAPTDLLGLNYYSRSTVRHDDADPRWHAASVEEDGERTQVDWLVVPEGLEDLLRWVHAEYAPPALHVTENGAAFPDVVAADGAVHDDRRIAYLDGHFRAAGRAIAAGVPLRGYFVWSLLDNFEWALGYDVRFGIVRVDFDTLERTPKDSFRWYRDVIAANGLGDG
ncbi:MAG: glycoside hydrolase family 1 protein, partial [Actinomycetota bacterium]